MTTAKAIMTKNPVIIPARYTLKDAAYEMETLDCGVLPVGTNKSLEGIITDRDIVIRAIAKGKDPMVEKVKDHMTRDVFYCNEDDTVETVAAQMRDHQVNRLIVKNSNGSVSGIISFGCILRKDKNSKEVSNVVEFAVGRKSAGA